MYFIYFLLGLILYVFFGLLFSITYQKVIKPTEKDTPVEIIFLFWPLSFTATMIAYFCIYIFKYFTTEKDKIKCPDHVKRMIDALNCHGVTDKMKRIQKRYYVNCEEIEMIFDNIHKVKFDECRKICNQITLSVERWALLESIDRRESWDDLAVFLNDKFEKLLGYYKAYRDEKLEKFKEAI